MKAKPTEKSLPLGLNKKEYKLLYRLNTPIKIQNYLDTLPLNFEKYGGTNMSPRMVLEKKKAHCMEAALLAATALWLQGQPPLLLDLKAFPHDDDHVVALYRINGLWGAISKTNHTSLRFRDPIYRTLRELTLSYFHEYFLTKSGRKVMYGYSAAFALQRFGTSWITAEDDLWDLCDALEASRHYSLFPKKNEKYIRRADTMEKKAGAITEWKERDKRT